MDTVELKCNSCGGNLIITEKGLVCPNCDAGKKLVLKKSLFGFKVIESVNVLLHVPFVTLEQADELRKAGVDVSITY